MAVLVRFRPGKNRGVAGAGVTEERFHLRAMRQPIGHELAALRDLPAQGVGKDEEMQSPGVQRARNWRAAAIKRDGLKGFTK